MAFYINPGELRTPIRFQNQVVAGQGAHKTTTFVDIGNESANDPPRYTKTKWMSEPGRLAYLSSALQTIVSAEVTVRYNAKITEQTQILNGSRYDIIDVDDPDQHKRWMVIRVKASVNS